MTGKNVIEKAFEVIFAERIYKVAYKKCSDNDKFHAADLKANDLFNSLKDSLKTNEQKEVLDELETFWNLAHSYLFKQIYIQGLKDYPMIHKELRKYGISINKVCKI